MTTTPAQFLTTQEAAAEFKTSESNLRRLAAAGHLTRRKSARDGRRVLFNRDELSRVFAPDAVRRIAS